MAAEAIKDLPEVRLVLLGRAGAGTGSVGNIILGSKAFPEGDVKASQKQKAVIADKEVIVIASPDWYSAAATPADVQRHISSFVALSAPGPHAFLLCVPVNKPADGEAKALEMMEQLFGATSVSKHTIVIFTHTDELKEGEKLEEYLSTNRKDLLELVKKCGDRQLVLKDAGSVADLLQTVDEIVKKSGVKHFTSSIYEEAEARVKEQVEKHIKAGEKPGEESGKGSIPAEMMKKVREAAEKTVHDNLNTDKPLPIVFRLVSIFLGIYAQLAVWMAWGSRMSSLFDREALKGALVSRLSQLPNLVSRQALLEPLISLFVGGPLGKILGAAVGSVATEVETRKEAEK